MKSVVVRSLFAIAIICFSVSSKASLITVEFQITNYNSQMGTFTGFDVDGDLLLEFSELSSFDWSSRRFGYFLDLDDVLAFGDFDLSTYQWIPNGSSPSGSRTDYYFAWNNYGNSVRRSWARMSILSVSVNTPATLSMMLVVLVAGLFMRFRR